MGNLRRQLISVQDSQGDVKSLDHGIPFWLSPNGRMSDVTERAGGESQQVPNHVTSFADESTVGVLDAIKLGYSHVPTFCLSLLWMSVPVVAERNIGLWPRQSEFFGRYDGELVCVDDGVTTPFFFTAYAQGHQSD